MSRQVAGLNLICLGKNFPTHWWGVEKTFQRAAPGSALKKHKLHFGLFFWPLSTGRKPVAPSTLLTPLGGTLTLRCTLVTEKLLAIKTHKKSNKTNMINTSKKTWKKSQPKLQLGEVVGISQPRISTCRPDQQLLLSSKVPSKSATERKRTLTH